MENKFITGLFTSRRDNAPDFVLANLSFKVEQFIEWLKENQNDKGYVNIDVLKGKDTYDEKGELVKGKPYSKINDWKPTTLPNTDINGNDRDNSVLSGESEIKVENIPF